MSRSERRLKPSPAAVGIVPGAHHTVVVALIGGEVALIADLARQGASLRRYLEAIVAEVDCVATAGSTIAVQGSSLERAPGIDRQLVLIDQATIVGAVLGHFPEAQLVTLAHPPGTPGTPARHNLATAAERLAAAVARAGWRNAHGGHAAAG